MVGSFLGERLPANVYESFREKMMTGVVSTVDDDGYPRGAPVSLFYALDDKTMLVGVQNRSQTYKNSVRESKIALTFISGGDLAFTIRGKARVFKEQMKSSKFIGILVVDVEFVKSDVAVDVEVTEGIKLKVRSPEWKEFLANVFSELRSYTLDDVRAL